MENDNVISLEYAKRKKEKKKMNTNTRYNSNSSSNDILENVNTITEAFDNIFGSLFYQDDEKK